MPKNYSYNDEPQGLSVYITATPSEEIADTSITLTANVSYGQSPYTYEWYGGEDLIQGANGNSITVVNIGTYRVMVTDSVGATATAVIAISAAPITPLTHISVTTGRRRLTVRPTLADGETALILIKPNDTESTYNPSISDVNVVISGARDDYNQASTIGDGYKVVGYLTASEPLTSITNLVGRIQYETRAYKVRVSNGLVIAISEGLSKITKTLL